MKHTVLQMIAGLCLLATLPTAACAAGSRYTVRELREATRGGWHATYTNCRNETVSVNVELQVPDVTACPVLRVADDAALPDSRCDGLVAYRENHLTTFQGPRYPDNIEGGSLPMPGGLAEGSPLRPEEINGLAQAVLARYAPYYDGVTLVPRCQTAYSRYYAFVKNEQGEIIGTDPSAPVTPSGYYKASYWQAFHGIPWLVNDYFEADGGNALNVDPWYLSGCWYSADSWYFHVQVKREAAVVSDDVPLVPFAEVQSRYEQWIREGKIRSVTDVRLGYMLFAAQDNGDVPYVLAPVWVLYGDLYPDADTATVSYTDCRGNRADPFVRAVNDRCVVVDAQTGELLDRFADTAGDRQVFHGCRNGDDMP